MKFNFFALFVHKITLKNILYVPDKQPQLYQSQVILPEHNYTYAIKCLVMKKSYTLDYIIYIVNY